MHRVDFSKPVDPMSMAGGSGGSPYIKDLADKLNFIRLELLNRMSLGDFMKEWYVGLFSGIEPWPGSSSALQGSINRQLCDQYLPSPRFNYAALGRKWQAEAHWRHDRAGICLGYLFDHGHCTRAAEHHAAGDGRRCI